MPLGVFRSYDGNPREGPIGDPGVMVNYTLRHASSIISGQVRYASIITGNQLKWYPMSIVGYASMVE